MYVCRRVCMYIGAYVYRRVCMYMGVYVCI